MTWDSFLLITLFDLLIVIFCAKLYSMYSHKFRRSNFTIDKLGRRIGYVGATLILCAISFELTQRYAFTTILSSFLSQSAAPFAIITGNILLATGLIICLSKLASQFSGRLAELQSQKEKLDANYDKISLRISIKEEKLLDSHHKLQLALEDQELSKMALAQCERKYHALYDTNPSPLITLNEHETITDINLFGANLLGYDPIELAGKNISKIISLDDIERAKAFFQNSFKEKENDRAPVEIKFVNRMNERIWVQIHSQIITEPNLDKVLLLACQNITTLKNLAEKLSFQASHDDLTKLHNRRALEGYIADLLEKQVALENISALIYFDIDQLKVVNDTCGHVAGDCLINQLVSHIHCATLTCDFFARIGGDEFALVKDNTTREEALAIGEALCSSARNFTFLWEGQSFPQSISVGVALTSSNVKTLTDLFGAADAACYSAKENGRNRVELHNHDIPCSADRRTEMLWVSRLQSALTNNAFELFFQPIIQIGHPSDSYVHYEVLIRYIDDQGLHSPDTFLPAAERFGLAADIDLWVLKQTLSYLNNHPEHTRIVNSCSINLTSHSIASRQTRTKIIELVQSTAFPTNKICFEITETSAIRNLSEAVDFINDLKLLGCRFALDDFGTGFSSLDYLKNLDVDYIKIDGSFIKDISNDRVDRAMVTAINTISKEMGILTIAEYVENDKTVKELDLIRVPLGQGFGLAKPMPMKNIHDFYHVQHRTDQGGTDQNKQSHNRPDRHVELSCQHTSPSDTFNKEIAY